MYMMLTGMDRFEEEVNLEDDIKFKKINFEKIENKKLREINEKLLCRNFEERISAKEGVVMLQNVINNSSNIKNKTGLIINKIKIPRENFDYGGVEFLIGLLCNDF